MPADEPEAAVDLMDDTFFTCERFRCRMRKQICVDRQAEWDPDAPRMPIARARFDACADCEQGRKIREEVGMEQPPEGFKKCNKCGEIKPFEAFARHPSTRDRRDGTCKKCKAEYFRQRAAKKRDSPIKICIVEGCGQHVRARGLCHNHYMQWRAGVGKMVETRNGGREWKRCFQ